MVLYASPGQHGVLGQKQCARRSQLQRVWEVQPKDRPVSDQPRPPANQQEQDAIDRCNAALDTMATIWASKTDLRGNVKKLLATPDREDRLVEFIKLAHAEGLYEGRTSHVRENDNDQSAGPRQ
jgi:hypothetical protein